MPAPPTLNVISHSRGLWLKRLRSTKRRWETKDSETGSATSARGAVASERDMNATYNGLCDLQLRAAASLLDSPLFSCYVPTTTPIDSTVGSRPPERAVSVFVWE